MPKQTLLLVFIHGFKGTDNTFSAFPSDLRSLIAHTLPQVDILSVQYPQYETRGDLKECVERFREWLVNKVIDLEVANGTPSPTVEPGVRVVLVGHSMGGIVAAESVLGVVGEEVIGKDTGAEKKAGSNGNGTPSGKQGQESAEDSSSSEPPLPPDPTSSTLFFPRIQAVLAFDTPYLGISPGVLAHGAEEHLNTASSAYKAYNNASSFFGWKSPGSSSPNPQQIPGASSKGLPAADGSTGGRSWGKYAMYGGAAAALAAAGGAAYMNWNQIGNGMKWAGSHLEFVGCLARGAELQKRVEKVVALRKSHGVGFANFYGALGKKTTEATKYAGAIVGEDRTFCVVPKAATASSTGSKRSSPSSTKTDPPSKRRKSGLTEAEGMEAEMEGGEQVQEFADDASKSKGYWVKCLNDAATDELKAHTRFFDPKKNPGYHGMLSSARDWLVDIVEESGWVEEQESSDGLEDDGDEEPVVVESASAADG